MRTGKGINTVGGRTVAMADYPTREYIIRETTYPDATKRELIGELVRCKNCKHFIIYDENVGFCMTSKSLKRTNGYCDDGERKDGDNG